MEEGTSTGKRMRLPLSLCRDPNAAIADAQTVVRSGD